MNTALTSRDIASMTAHAAGIKAENARPLNYDPADPDKMRLPSGVTCGDCVHIRRCSAIFGHTATDTYCDWSPSRLQARPTAAPAIPAEAAHIGAALDGESLEQGEVL